MQNDTRDDYMAAAALTVLFSEMLDGRSTQHVWTSTDRNPGREILLSKAAAEAGFKPRSEVLEADQFFVLEGDMFYFVGDKPKGGKEIAESVNLYAALGMYSDFGVIPEDKAIEQWDAASNDKGMAALIRLLAGMTGKRALPGKLGCGSLGVIKIETIQNGEPHTTGVCVSCVLEAVHGDDRLLDMFRSDDAKFRALLMAFLAKHGIDVNARSEQVGQNAAPVVEASNKVH